MHWAIAKATRMHWAKAKQTARVTDLRWLTDSVMHSAKVTVTPKDSLTVTRTQTDSDSAMQRD